MATDHELADRAVRSLAQSWAEEMSLCRQARAQGGCEVTDLLGTVARSIVRIRAEIAAEAEHGPPPVRIHYVRGEPRTTLTAREAEILTLAAQGLGSPEIGRRLGISAVTVRKHLYITNLVLGTRSRQEAAEVALARGLIKLEDTEAA